MKRFLILFLCISCTSISQAQFVSPYKLSLAVDIPISSNSVALLGTSYLIGTSWNIPSKESIATLNRSDINPLDRGATYQHSKIAGYFSDAALYSSIGLPLLQLINKNSRKDFGKVAAINAEVIVLNLAVTDLFKETIRRKRPLLYNPDVPIDAKYTKDNFKSFFSGHTSTVASMSFCFATMFAQYNPNSKAKPAVWVLCAAFPAITGILRYKAGEHYWTDIITGYAVGALLGVGVPYLHNVKLKINR